MAETAEDRRTGRSWPAYLFGGRVRTSTVALILAFVLLWWAYESYGPAPEDPDQVPAAEVVPPGFIPDPAYTWVPRTDVQRTPATTTPTTPTSPTTTTPTSQTTAPGATTTPGEDADAVTGTPAETATTATAPAMTAPPTPMPTSAPTATPATPSP